jgi:hypothetical protein
VSPLSSVTIVKKQSSYFKKQPLYLNTLLQSEQSIALDLASYEVVKSHRHALKSILEQGVIHLCVCNEVGLRQRRLWAAELSNYLVQFLEFNTEFAFFAGTLQTAKVCCLVV